MSERDAERAPVTLRTIARMVERGERFACLTCYDATTARWLERAGVHVLLVGDTAAEMVLGFDRTIDMPLDVLLALTAGVKRGAPSTLVMGDMPFMSYQADEAQGVRNAGRFLTDGLADVVKLEVDESFAPLVTKMARAGVPVCAHVGSRPQHVVRDAGYRSAGKTASEATRVVRDAMVMIEAGAVMLLVEAVPPEVGQRIASEAGALGVPVIGIGAGDAPHGQILVLQDAMGMTDKPPRFAEPVASLGPAMRDAGAEWVRRVAEGRIGGRGYEMSPGERDRFVGANGMAVSSRPVEGDDAAPVRGR